MTHFFFLSSAFSPLFISLGCFCPSSSIFLFFFCLRLLSSPFCSFFFIFIHHFSSIPPFSLRRSVFSRSLSVSSFSFLPFYFFPQCLPFFFVSTFSTSFFHLCHLLFFPSFLRPLFSPIFFVCFLYICRFFPLLFFFFSLWSFSFFHPRKSGLTVEVEF